MKARLDSLLVKKGLADDLKKAAALCMAGSVTVDGKTVPHAGAMVGDAADIAVALSSDDYVSRGGLKLEGALDDFGIALSGLECCDVGSSTGGFTECMLRRGAKRVYAFDVGKNLMRERVARDPRVTLVEGYNFRRFAERCRPSDGLLSAALGRLPPLSDEEKAQESARGCRFVAVDVSFISVVKILGALAEGMDQEFETLALVKPQFELPPRMAPAGIVRDAVAAAEAARDVATRAGILGFKPMGISKSRIKGARGNQEFFVYLVRERQG